jgi:hypothetical protein
MEQENDIFEYEWGKVILGYLILFVFSLALIGIWYLGNQLADDRYTLFRLSSLSILGSLGLIWSILGIWTIWFVPKVIIFDKDSINITFPFGRKRIFHYEDISRIIVSRSITKRNQLLVTSWSPFRVTIYLLNSTIKVKFNPDRLMNFNFLLVSLQKKGLGSLIEQK